MHSTTKARPGGSAAYFVFNNILLQSMTFIEQQHAQITKDDCREYYNIKAINERKEVGKSILKLPIPTLSPLYIALLSSLR